MPVEWAIPTDEIIAVLRGRLAEMDAAARMKTLNKISGFNCQDKVKKLEKENAQMRSALRRVEPGDRGFRAASQALAKKQ